MEKEIAEKLLRKLTNNPLASCNLLPQSGSARKNYVGISGDQKFIITSNDNLKENEAFLYFSTVFEEVHLNTPKIVHVSDDKKIYIQEYLGNQTLSEIIEQEGESARVKKLVQESLQQLYTLQQKTSHLIDYSQTFEYQEYNELPISHDLFYFKFMLVDILELPYHKSTLLQEFKKLETMITRLLPQGIMIRDFQSRNIIVDDKDAVFFIDYQAAMRGPLMYDVVSFLYQAKANFSTIFIEEMLAFYYQLWDDEETRKELKNSLQPLIFIRFIQVLGAYGFRGIVQGKKHFRESLTKGIYNIVDFAENWEHIKDFPELHSIIQQLSQDTTAQKLNNLLENKH